MMGHSDAGLTMNVYGQWSEAALRAEAQRLDEEAFPL
jgi:integrase